ncbi:hypothetical protein GCM10022408_00400 [Hymenobacter fastidiosus]|uniref:Probable beta-carotene 15,15'-dioxygenase n=1 Tax=Hymenobacter fastidiosus TaxID=486264 RepID=A0ABP7R947_9BACT
MSPLTLINRPAWGAALPRRASYGFVLVAVAVGLLAPGLAHWLLAPLLLAGMLLLGVAHGACDQFVVPATHPALARERLRYWAGFLIGYLGLALAVGLLWWWQPAAAVALFFGLTAWHWGSADAPALAPNRGQWIAHSLLRGGLLFAVPLGYWPEETRTIINDLLTLGGAMPVRAVAVAQTAVLLGPSVAVGHLLLWGSYFRQNRGGVARTDMLEVLLLTILLMALAPILSAGVYFVFWHSLQHVLRMNQLMGRPLLSRRPALRTELGFFLRRSAPLLLLSLAGLAILYGVAWSRAATGSVFVSLALLVASVVTLPHALLVTLGMDAARWR